MCAHVLCGFHGYSIEVPCELSGFSKSGMVYELGDSAPDQLYACIVTLFIEHMWMCHGLCRRRRVLTAEVVSGGGVECMPSWL